jgi:anti-sigma-K factor RskA
MTNNAGVRGRPIAPLVLRAQERAYLERQVRRRRVARTYVRAGWCRYLCTMATPASENRPRVADWFARIKARPRYKGTRTIRRLSTTTPDVMAQHSNRPQHW